MQFTKTQKTVAAWGAIAAAVVFLVWLLGPVLTPFIVASVLAYALTPLVNKLDRGWFSGKLPRVLAVIVVELLFIVSVLAVALLIVPILAKEIPLLREQLPALAERINAWATPILKGLGIDLQLDVASIKAFVLKYLNANVEEGFAALLASLKVGGSLALTLIGNAILIPVALFYLLMDWENFVKRAVELVPHRLRGAYDSFMHEADEVLGQYLRGQMLVMLILAIYFTVGLALFGLDLALPIGVFTGLAIFVPYVGFGVGLVLALLAGLLEFASIKAVVMVAVVYGAGQLIESLFLTPRLVGERIGLHPLAVIFALLAFGQLFGFVGVLIALPASAVLLVAIRRLRMQYLASDLYKAK
jgi:predicted PurR-regulated permease PerM